MCIELICLFLNNYLAPQEFEKVFYHLLSECETILPNQLFSNILETDFRSKSDVLSLKIRLRAYINNNCYCDILDGTNDIYIEKILESARQDIVADILREKSKRKEIVYLDCAKITSEIELISLLKKKFEFPSMCGNNWDAINDLILEIKLPYKIVIYNWNYLEKALPKEAKAFMEILVRLKNKSEVHFVNKR